MVNLAYETLSGSRTEIREFFLGLRSGEDVSYSYFRSKVPGFEARPKIELIEAFDYFEYHNAIRRKKGGKAVYTGNVPSINYPAWADFTNSLNQEK